ncbi:Cysteine-rich repeat secretory protein 15 [Rhynchospora pubera]|uniref:Cysteine-rich repeat secretory protein 15 n=1 Tax=Rhynchospora pubera TaxID=906938 RepID=A0AAV8BV78_9POAL|nr:Cysteine-rich repeat secretory protein 15 [Rhynchospora pubera]
MLCFLYITTTLLFLAQHHHQAFSTSTFVYAGCFPSKFPENTQYQTNLNSLFSSIATTASHAIYNSFTTGTDSPPGNAVYGLYQCRGDLDTPSCASCIQNGIAQLSLVCSYAFSASLQLDSCFIRYSNNNFLGQNDTNLAYQRCSTSTSSDADFVRRRDDVLADLQSGDGFRVTSSGLVQGYAQCIGDLATADCTTCLAEAVSQLRNSCGSAKAADVYLAQCYARYWASGYYFHSPAEYSDEDIGRTVAIIVGVLAGLALFVVFISFFKRTSSKGI